MAQASLGTDGQQVIDRIGFAERWLDRAKRQCQDGDVPRGLLTLFLANAEMAHTLRTAQPMVSPRRRAYASALAIAAVLMLTCVALLGWKVVSPAPASAEDGPTIITLGGRVGSLLELVEATPHQTVAPGVRQGKAQSKSVRRHAVGTRRPQRSLSPARPAPATYVSGVSKSAIAMPPAAPFQSKLAEPSGSRVVAAVEGGPSDVELISLVLTAERTLRTQSRP